MSNSKNKRSEEFLKIIHKLQDISGFLNVHKHKADNIKGFKWVYSYKENGKNKTISNIHLFVLKYIVISRKLPWEIVDSSQSFRSIKLEESKYDLFDNGSGILFLDIIKNQFSPFNGFWCYKFNKNVIYSEDLKELKSIVDKNKLPWIILNEINANNSYDYEVNFESGINMVNKIKHNQYIGLFKWVFVYKSNEEYRFLVNEDLNALKNDIIKNNCSWQIIDENKFNKSMIDNKLNLGRVNHFKWKDTGIYRVKKIIRPEILQGFLWTYRYKEKGKKIEFSSTDLLKLREKVINNGLDWKIIDGSLAKKSFKENKDNSKKFGFMNTGNKTGIFRVYKNKNNKTAQGFYWTYGYSINNKKKSISSVNLKKLKEKVIKNGLDWIIVDENLFKESLKENEINMKKYYN